MTPTLALVVLLASPCVSQEQVDLLRSVRARLGGDRPGVAVAILKEGEVLAAEAFGNADLESGEPMTTATPVYIASLAKTFTAAAAVHAARAGLLDLDAPLDEVLDELPEAYAASSLRQCLGHRSGLPDVYDVAILCDLGRDPVGSNEAALALVRELAPSFPPGSRVVYSNTGYVAVAEALSRAGHALPDYAREHLFEPLGMEGAAYDPTVPRAVAYRAGSGRRRAADPTGLVGPGGMVASLDDLVSFALAFEGGEWGDAGLRAELLAVPAGLAHPSLGRPASGWMLQNVRGVEARRHSGGAFGYSSDLLVVPGHGLVLVALSCDQAVSAPGLNGELLASTLAHLGVPDTFPSEPLPDVDEESARRLTGLWRRADGRTVIVVRDDFSWIVTTLGDVRVRLEPAGPLRMEVSPAFAQGPCALQVRAGDDGVDVLYLDLGDGEVAHRRVPGAQAGGAQQVRGIYESEALGARIELRSTDGRELELVQHDPLLALSRFTELGQDHWLCNDGALLVVERDREHAVTGFVAHANRAWGLRFRRVD